MTPLSTFPTSSVSWLMSAGSRLITARKTMPGDECRDEPRSVERGRDAVGERGAGAGTTCRQAPSIRSRLPGVDDDGADQEAADDPADDPVADLLEQQRGRACALRRCAIRRQRQQRRRTAAARRSRR